MNKPVRVAVFSDLDNTLIYSYKREIGAEKVPVEKYEGRVVSYMTRFSYRALLALCGMRGGSGAGGDQPDAGSGGRWMEAARSGLLFVPVTTRSVAQYRRICFGDWQPPFALVSNGGTLLVNGQGADAGTEATAAPHGCQSGSAALAARWRRESLARVAPCEAALSEAEAVLARDPSRTFEVRRVDGFFVFTKSDAPDETKTRLANALSGAPVDAFTNGNKVYAVPRVLNKGATVRRFLRLLPELYAADGTGDAHGTFAEGAVSSAGDADIGAADFGDSVPFVVCAGDSEFDLSFLCQGDVAFCPETLAAALRSETARAFEASRASDFAPQHFPETARAFEASRASGFALQHFPRAARPRIYPAPDGTLLSDALFSYLRRLAEGKGYL